MQMQQNSYHIPGISNAIAKQQILPKFEYRFPTYIVTLAVLLAVSLPPLESVLSGAHLAALLEP